MPPSQGNIIIIAPKQLKHLLSAQCCVTVSVLKFTNENEPLFNNDFLGHKHILAEQESVKLLVNQSLLKTHCFALTIMIRIMLSDLPPSLKIPETAVYMALNDFFSSLEITIFNASSNLLYESNLTGRRNSIVRYPNKRLCSSLTVSLVVGALLG